MQIDWITVVAQILNFLVLVWLLRKLLYGPITRAMEKREANIGERFDEAERREKDAEAERQRLDAEREELRAAREDMLAKARDEARRLQHDLENQARAEVRENRRVWQLQLREEEADFLHDLRAKTAGYVTGVLRRALSDFAGSDLEDAMTDTFVNRLQRLDAETLEALRAEAKAANGQVSVTSAFELPPPAKARLTRAIRQSIHPDAEIGYWLDSDLVCGFRLRIRGQTIQWSVDAYLDDLEEEARAFFETAEEPVAAHPASRPEPAG